MAERGDEEEEVLSGEEGGFGEEAVMEVMKRLEAEITRSGSSSSSCDTYTCGNHEKFGPSSDQSHGQHQHGRTGFSDAEFQRNRARQQPYSRSKRAELHLLN
ncbi:hypothetical protein AMTR_s00012p00250600 [Amborella trichopoda]|uniref:Uncharacterized protein n=1 Tax=Amborella trichopoda TaxID=13333 RepID=W1PJW8_AMBTC|nr:hypothetical protein AMTR_s00012p00250600 [Amborella trichopoda]